MRPSLGSVKRRAGKASYMQFKSKKVDTSNVTDQRKLYDEMIDAKKEAGRQRTGQSRMGPYSVPYPKKKRKG